MHDTTDGTAVTGQRRARALSGRGKARGSAHHKFHGSYTEGDQEDDGGDRGGGGKGELGKVLEQAERKNDADGGNQNYHVAIREKKVGAAPDLLAKF